MGKDRRTGKMKTIGKYEIYGLLGKGGMGRIYKTAIPVIGKIVALKLLDPYPALLKLVGRDRLRRLFVSEAAAMANLRHPNIVDVLDFGEADGKPFYTMDYFCHNLGVMIGETYWADEPSRVINIEKAIGYMREILNGLSCLHHAGIVHRDIKPYNILVTDHDVAKICDFGLSKLRGEKFDGPPNLKVGSPWYAAPEQEADPDGADARADLYSAGVMLHRMLTGILPGKNARPMAELNPDLDENWDRFIGKAMASDRKDRFASADDMRRELDNLETDWERRKENICALPRANMQNKSETGTRLRLRNTPIKTLPAKAKDRFGTDNLWRPARYVKNEFVPRNENTVVDNTTGLLWQRSGSEYPLSRDQALSYVSNLNETALSGHADWRLPTVEELMSLLEPTPHETDFCVMPIFDRKQKWIWSADKSAHTSAWYVNMEMGFVGRNDFSGFFHVRACRGFHDG